MIYSSEDMQTRAVLDTAARMCAAARTAPKTRGMDGLVTCVVTGEDKDRLAAHMRELAGRLDYAFFARDADNVDYADAVVLFGMEEQRRGLNGGCQYCHFADCADCAEKNGLCAWDAMDVGIAIGLKKGNALRDQINTVLAEITEEQRSQLMEQIVTLASGGTVTEFAVHCDAPATTTGTLKIGMECAYEPYNWTDTDGSSFGAVPISSEGQQGLYANGYDVQIAQYVANRLGLKLEIYAMEWDSLIPAVNSGAIDAIVAGMSPTAERAQEIDFTDTYYESNLVVIIRK